MFFNDGRRDVRWERFGMDDESAKDPAVFYIRIFGRLVIEKLFLALRSFFFSFCPSGLLFSNLPSGDVSHFHRPWGVVPVLMIKKV